MDEAQVGGAVGRMQKPGGEEVGRWGQGAVTVRVKFILRCLFDISVGTVGNVKLKRNRLCYKR